MSRQKIATALSSQLPHLSPTEISQHEDWYRAMRSAQDKRKKTVSSFEKRREELLQDAQDNIDTARRRAAEDLIVAEEIAKHERNRLCTVTIFHRGLLLDLSVELNCS